MDNCFKKINNLPDDIKAYFMSSKSAELNLFICNKYKIASIKDYTIMIGRMFCGELRLPDLQNELIKLFKIDSKLVKKVALDVVGTRILVADRYFEKKASEYIKKNGGNIDDYNRYIKQYKVAVEEENKYFEEQIKEKEVFVGVIKKEEVKEDSFNPAIERESNIKIFNSNIIGLLTSKPGPHIDDYNNSLLNLLLDKKTGLNFRNDLVKAYFSNNQKVTNSSLMYNDKKIRPTVSNWIKYFIKVKGSDLFNKIVLTDFMTKSENVKKLSNDEKVLVTRILELYRNVKFFPRSMADKARDGWEIIPSPRKIDKQKDKVELPEQVSKEEKDSIVKKVEDEKKYEHKLAEMELLIGKYPDDSLERKLIEEEIIKFKKNKQK